MKRFIYTILFCAVSLFSFAQSQKEQQIIDKIAKSAQDMKSMQCNFIQTKHLKMLNDKMVSNGIMYYQQPNKLRWEYTTPYSYTFILNDSKVLLKKGERNDVIDVNQNKMFKEIARMMMNSVVGKCLSDKKSFKTSIKEEQSEYVATLIPLKSDMKKMWSKLILHFDRKLSSVIKVEMHEKNGDKTIIELKNTQINKSINAKVFAIE